MNINIATVIHQRAGLDCFWRRLRRCEMQHVIFHGDFLTAAVAAVYQGQEVLHDYRCLLSYSCCRFWVGRGTRITERKNIVMFRMLHAMLMNINIATVIRQRAGPDCFWWRLRRREMQHVVFHSNFLTFLVTADNFKCCFPVGTINRHQVMLKVHIYAISLCHLV